MINSHTIKEVAIDLSSVSKEKWINALKVLKTILPTLDVNEFEWVGVGLFYFYWYSDGAIAQ